MTSAREAEPGCSLSEAPATEESAAAVTAVATEFARLEARDTIPSVRRGSAAPGTTSPW